MSKVIVDREDFKYALRCARSSEGRLRGPTLRRLLAALDRDPDALIEQVVEALLDNNPGWGTWETVSDEDRRVFLSDARAALAAITGEGKEA